MDFLTNLAFLKTQPSIFTKAWLAFLLTSLLAFLLTPLVIKIYKKLGWLDDPKKQKHPKVIHKYPVPRGGGIPIFLSILITSLIFLPLDKHLIGILLGGGLILIIGVLDDKFNLNPYLRLGISLLAAFCVVGAGIGIPFITSPFGGIIKLNQPQIPIFIFGKLRTIWILADFFAVLWILWSMNFVNWVKGVDGQLPGIVVIAGITIGLLSLRFSADITQWPVIILALALAGSYLGFLPWNFFPQKIMPGYGGGALAGYFLAVLTILSTTKVGTGIMVLAIPMLDGIYSMIRRIKKGKSPVWGDAGHLHHKLLELGWGKRRVAVFYWLITALFGLLALVLKTEAKFYTIILLTVVFGGILLWLNYFISSSSHQDQSNG
jgi:UDP-GlcNAc:undecaprenyl-phosphate/decaprenyl-phosphate GlcNAc-1-phosphate transferase